MGLSATPNKINPGYPQSIRIYGTDINGNVTEVFTDANGDLQTVIMDGNGHIIGTATNPVRVDPTGTTVQPVSISNPPSGTQNVAASQVSVSNSSTQIVGTRSGRVAVKITNLGTTDVYIGASGVTTSTGDLLLGTKGSFVILDTQAAVFGVVGTGSQTVSVLEEY